MTSLRPLRHVVLGLALAITSTVAVDAATPMPFSAPAPDIAPLAPFAPLPLEKPAITLMDATPPAMSIDFPSVPPVPIAVPVAPRPAAPLTVESSSPCDGAGARTATGALECGKSRLKKGEHDGAAQMLQDAVRNGKDRATLIAALYWLGETLIRLNRIPDADTAFAQIVAERPGHDYEGWSAHAS